MKRLIIIVLAAAVVSTGLSSVASYSTKDNIAAQRGWPIGYYHYVDATSSNNLESLCLGAPTPDIGVASEQCAETIPVFSYSRIALNFAVWLAVSSVAGGAFYFFRPKPKSK